MVAAQICMLVTVMAVLCQAVGIFLPGWITPEDPKKGVQIGVWYACIDWKKCAHYFDDFKTIVKAKTITSLFVEQVILMVTETLAFLLLAVAATVAGMAACTKKKPNHMKYLTGLNIGGCFLIMCGVLSSVTLFTSFNSVDSNYGYAFYLSCVAAFLSLISGMLACCFTNNSSDRLSRHRRQEHSADKHYNDQQYYPEYQYQQQNYPTGYGGASPFYG